MGIKIRLAASRNFLSAQTLDSRPLHSTLRANPFPKVTDLFCRLPLPTLCYRPEAVYLGDLVRMWVRPEVRVILSLNVSRTVENSPDTSQDKVLCPLSRPITRQSDSRAQKGQQEKITLSGIPSRVAEFAYVTMQHPLSDPGILAGLPFEGRDKVYVRRVSLLLRDA